ncbi:MAG: DUF6515 family protein [Pseudomonadota bacterium]
MRTRQSWGTLVGIIAIAVATAQPPPGPRPHVPPPGVPGAAAPPGYPIGQRLYRLPSGHEQVRHGGRTYVFYDGHFYASDGDEYVAIAPPMGAVVPRLPSEAERVGNLSQRVYRFRGVHYRQLSRGFQVIAAP